ncbi:glycosyltransferase family 2 protein [Faecalibacter macacae]|uniref:Glycosyltransferase family 2 protein n=1 Tax=Faecalibacter macacae TaxID=1859289 RepID=A0A3L9MIV2_9FLAO|nr:glycosyltransferase family 2 protein [Faecalibacter macacae]RLZ12702.1 glycosyltransferase family 2 protein [Faecalibacter macacae]
MTNLKPNLSIIIANYNNGHFFKDCYTSLVNQNETNWEAIVIDDCSSDTSIDLILPLIEGDSRFRFFKNEVNVGYQQTVRKAIELCRSDLFARLDPDDALMPNAIEKSIKLHKEFPEVGLVYSNNIICDEYLNPLTRLNGSYIRHKGRQLTNEKFIFGEVGHFATFKKSIYDKTDGIDIFNRRAEDQDIYMKIFEISPVKYIDEELYLYRVHDGGVSTNENSDKALFWHWVAIIKSAERQGINPEELFFKQFVRIEMLDREIYHINLIKKSRWMKIGRFLGFFKLYKNL